MVRHLRRDHRYHEPVAQRSGLGFRRQARWTPLPSGDNQDLVEPPGAPVWSVVSAPVPSRRCPANGRAVPPVGTASVTWCATGNTGNVHPISSTQNTQTGTGK